MRDAGLKVSDIDGVFTAGQHSPATIAEAFGVAPRYVDGTTVGGCSFIIMAGHAMVALRHGLCDVAVISHGESGRSGAGVTPTDFDHESVRQLRGECGPRQVRTPGSRS